MDNTLLLHIAHRSDLMAADANGRYRAASLASEGFLHCCHPNQLPGVVSRWFKNIDDLVLLTLDPAHLDARLVHENTSGGDELFPHVYGEIPTIAIADRRDFGLDSPYRQTLSENAS